VEKMNNNENRRRRTSTVVVVGVFSLLLLAALAIALAALINSVLKLDTLNRDVTILSNETADLITRLNEAEATIAILQAPPIHGWLAFWWTDPSYGQKHSWARFNETTGLMIGTPIPYSPSEARGSVFPNKAQFSRGPGPNELIYLVLADFTFAHYLVRHNTATGTYLRTNLGTNPADHETPTIVDYDPIHGRYIGVADITSQSQRHALVVMDENSGVITPLTGAGGLLAPAPVNNVLDMEVIGGYVLVFERWDDSPTQQGRILFYNSSDGQYVSESFFNGTFIPYNGTFTLSFYDPPPPSRLFYIAGSYNAATFRLHLILLPTSAGYERDFAWIQGDSESDLLNKLLTGNYDLHLTQHQSPFQLNAGVYLTS
jgi:hypothetical protein